MSKLQEFALDKIDSRTKHLVNGYIREMDSILKQIIPDPIIHFILSFYYLGDYFAKFDTKYWKITDKNTTIEKLKRGGWSIPSCFGNMIIRSEQGGIYQWIFKLLKTNTCMDFGISSNCNMDQAFSVCDDSSNYCARYAAHKVSKDKQVYWPGFHYKTGDKLTMELNLDQKSLSFYVNEKFIGIAWDNIDVGPDINYRMAVFFLHNACSVKLLSFKAL